VNGIGKLTRGVQVMDRPPLFSPFRHSHSVISRVEGPNDGLVSVASSQWGSYKGTLVGVSHLDLINWTNRLKWMLRGLAGRKPGYVRGSHLSLRCLGIAYACLVLTLLLSTSPLPICLRRRASSPATTRYHHAAARRLRVRCLANRTHPIPSSFQSLGRFSTPKSAST